MAVTKQDGIEWANEVRAQGFTIEQTRTETVLTITRSFEPGDTSAYCAAENAANALLRKAPVTQPGTTWGTDSGSVGGHSGLMGGYMRLSKSGVAKRFIQGATA